MPNSSLPQRITQSLAVQCGHVFASCVCIRAAGHTGPHVCDCGGAVGDGVEPVVYAMPKFPRLLTSETVEAYAAQWKESCVRCNREIVPFGAASGANDDGVCLVCLAEADGYISVIAWMEAQEEMQSTNDAIEAIIIGLDYLTFEGTDDDLKQALKLRSKQSGVSVEVQVKAIVDRLTLR